MPARREQSKRDRRAMSFVLDREAIDLHRFNHCVERARAAAYSGNIGEAGRLARSALADFAGVPFAGLRELASAEAVALQVEAHRLDMIELAADADLAAGKHDAVVAELELIAADNPFREGLWERLALALYRCGRQADALERLGRLRRGLLEELGLDPSASVLATGERNPAAGSDVGCSIDRAPAGRAGGARVASAGEPSGGRSLECRSRPRPSC